jgi:hypothetical protein
MQKSGKDGLNIILLQPQSDTVMNTEQATTHTHVNVPWQIADARGLSAIDLLQASVTSIQSYVEYN